MSIDHVRQSANVVLKALHTHGIRDAHATLESLISDLDDPGRDSAWRVEQTLQQMIAWADIAAFGYPPVDHMPLTQWWAWLRRLRESCREELENRQFECARQVVVRNEAQFPATDTCPAARTPSPDRIVRTFPPRTPALLAAGGALAVAGSIYAATIMNGMPPDQPAGLALAGAVALAALVSGVLAFQVLRPQPERIVPAE